MRTFSKHGKGKENLYIYFSAIGLLLIVIVFYGLDLLLDKKYLHFPVHWLSTLPLIYFSHYYWKRYNSHENGSSTIQQPVKNRPDWNKVDKVLKGIQPVSVLGC